MVQVLIHYLQLLKLPVSKRYIKKRIASHPDYPSLLSVSDSLKQLGIPHAAVRIDRENLNKLSFPYILHLEKNGDKFVLIKEENDLNKEPDMLNDWSGIVLQAEAPKSIENEENNEELKKEKTIKWAGGLFLLSILITFTLLTFQSFNGPRILFLVTAIMGAVLGYLLIAKDLGIKYDAVESFCNIGKHTNCDLVLHSEEAMLFSQLSLSEIVFSYFMTQLIIVGLLIPLVQSPAPFWWTMATIGILTLPVVGYSLWLQSAKMKNWCRLCLLVSSVLIVQTVLFAWMMKTNMFSLTDGKVWTTGALGGLFLFSNSLVFILKNRLKAGTEAKQAESIASRVKYNPSVFAYLLQQQPKANCAPFEQELMIGHPEAPVQITMAAGLKACSPCKQGFEKAKKLIRIYPGLVNLSIRLSLPQGTKEIDPGRYILGYWLHNIWKTKDSSKDTEKLLQDWFEWREKKRFQDKYPLQYDLYQEIGPIAHRHLNWFEQTGIKGTPTFFVNGYQLPKQYQIESLEYLILELNEQIPTVDSSSEEIEIEEQKIDIYLG